MTNRGFRPLRARDALGFDASDFRAAVSNAIAASFVSPDVKADVLARHFGWLSEG